MPETASDRRRRVAEEWWPLVARILGFFFGVFLIWDQAHAPNPPGAQEWIVVAGIGCMGPTVASAVATVVESIRGTSSALKPPSLPPPSGEPAPPSVTPGTAADAPPGDPPAESPGSP